MNPKISTNDLLVLAGTFHGVHAITRSLTPRIPLPHQQQPYQSGAANTFDSRGSGMKYTTPEPTLPTSGIEVLESSFFRLTVLQTLTGVKFLLFTSPSMEGTDTLMRGVYERYADYVCKNPFWQVEMPIRVEAWERSLNAWLGGRR